MLFEAYPPLSKDRLIPSNRTFQGRVGRLRYINTLPMSSLFFRVQSRGRLVCIVPSNLVVLSRSRSRFLPICLLRYLLILRPFIDIRSVNRSWFIFPFLPRL